MYIDDFLIKGFWDWGLGLGCYEYDNLYDNHNFDNAEFIHIPLHMTLW